MCYIRCRYVYVLLWQQFNGSEIYVQRYLIPKTTAKEPPTQRCDRSPYKHTHTQQTHIQTHIHTYTHTVRHVCCVYHTAAANWKYSFWKSFALNSSLSVCEFCLFNKFMFQSRAEEWEGAEKGKGEGERRGRGCWLVEALGRHTITYAATSPTP